MKSIREIIFECFTRNRQVTTDTRNLTENAIFFGLKGQNFNGSDFQEDAIKKGCALVVVDDKRIDDDRVVQVSDVLIALQELALDYRKSWKFPVIALTGSNGKTTTKELMRDVLATKYKVHATKGNLNNHIGIPLTILSAPEDTEIAVIEMGANHQKEIATYCEYAMPDYGYITNIGKAHLEGFGGQEGVKKGKKELYDYLHRTGGNIFVNLELPFMEEITANMKVIPFQSMSRFQVEDRGSGMRISVSQDGKDYHFDCHLTGLYNLYNVCVAWEIGSYFKVDLANIAEAIGAYQPENMRSQWKETNKNKLILDAYNANPTSLENAIIHLAQQRDSDILAIVGEMREMGDAAEKEHKHIVEVLENHQVPTILVGKEFALGSSVYPWFETVDELIVHLNDNPIEGKLILIKGSRGIQLEKVLPCL